MAIGLELRLAKHALESYDTYQQDILAAGNLASATCGVEAGDRFWGTLQGQRLVLADVKASVEKNVKIVTYVVRAAICTTIAESALVLVALFFKLSATPCIIVGVIAVFTIAAAIGSAINLKGIIKQYTALLAQEKIHKGIVPGYTLELGHPIPEGSFAPDDAEQRKRYAQIVLDVLKGPKRLAYCMMVEDQGVTAQYIERMRRLHGPLLPSERS